VIGIGSEGSISPDGVLRLGIGSPSAAQLGIVHVTDSDSFETAGEFRPVKVRISARARETSNVDQSADPMRKKNLVEFVSRSRGVTYCPDALLIRGLKFHATSLS
jgi:hypothetical protein